MNILVYRTVRTEEMGYVIKDICDKYGDDNNIKWTNRSQHSWIPSIPTAKQIFSFDIYDCMTI